MQSGLENVLASSQKEELWKMFQDAAEKELTGARKRINWIPVESTSYYSNRALSSHTAGVVVVHGAS